MLAFDFDGVIADGVDECLLVSWIARHDLGLDVFSPAGLHSVPSSFRDEFARLRQFVRHDGHFLVPFTDDTQEIDDPVAFGKRYDSIPASEREWFRKKFADIRTAAREVDETYWLRLHRTFPEVLQIIASFQRNVQIVSGKDASSIIEILRHQNIHLEDASVFGRLTSKTRVLRDLLAVARERGEELLFIDDNLPNVIEANDVGAKGYWASWGHHTDSDEIRARHEGIFILTLDNIGPMLGLPKSGA